MIRSKFSLSQTVLSATLTSGLLLITGLYKSVQAVEFQAPGDPAPQTSVGGGSRGNVQFSAPGESAPSNGVGGGVRGNVEFDPPGDNTPRNSAGGATRGDVQFSTPGESAPSNSVGGGVRGDAPKVMIALVPPSQQGRTVSARPTFFVYLPPTVSKEILFTLLDEEGNEHYQTRLKISGEGGIVSVTLPQDAPELEIGKNYVWFFEPIQPDGIVRPSNYVATGWVKRVETTGSTASTSPVDEATALGKAGIWYDTLNILAQAIRSQPGNASLAKEWQELLQQVGLNAIATQPIAEQL